MMFLVRCFFFLRNIFVFLFGTWKKEDREDSIMISFSCSVTPLRLSSNFHFPREGKESDRFYLLLSVLALLRASVSTVKFDSTYPFSLRFHPFLFPSGKRSEDTEGSHLFCSLSKHYSPSLSRGCIYRSSVPCSFSPILTLREEREGKRFHSRFLSFLALFRFNIPSPFSLRFHPSSSLLAKEGEEGSSVPFPPFLSTISLPPSLSRGSIVPLPFLSPIFIPMADMGGSRVEIEGRAAEAEKKRTRDRARKRVREEFFFLVRG